MDASLGRIEDSLLKLVSSSAAHETWLEAIDHRLGVLNGSVAKLQEKSTEAELFIATHPTKCEISKAVTELARQMEANRSERKSDIAAIKAEITAEQSEARGAERERSKWFHRLRPATILPYAILFVIIVMAVARNGDAILSVLNHMAGGK